MHHAQGVAATMHAGVNSGKSFLVENQGREAHSGDRRATSIRGVSFQLATQPKMAVA